MWDWLKKIKLPETDDSTGDRILNNTIKEANNASTQEERDSIYKDRAKKTLAVTGQSLMAIPMLGEFATYGLLGGGLRLGAGIAGSKAGEYVLGKGGDWADNKLGTNWIGTAGRIGGGLMGFGLGVKSTTPLLRSAAAKGITMHIPQETFNKLRNEAFANWSKKAYNRKLYVNPQESLTKELIDRPKGKGIQFHVDRHTFPDLNRDWETGRVLSDWSNKWGKEYVKDGMMLPGKAGSSLDEYIWFSEDHPYQIPTNNNFIIGSAKDLRTAKNQLVQGTPIPFPLTKGFPVNGGSIEYYKYLPIEKHPGTFGATIGTSGRVKFHEPILVSPQEAATTYHYDPRVDLLNRTYKQGGIIKAQHGNKLLNNWQQLYDSKFGNTIRKFFLGSQETNELGQPKYIGSSGILGMLVLPEFEGLEFPEITTMHYGMKGKPIGNAIDAERLTTVPKAISNTAKTKAVDQSFNKFLEKSTQEQDNIVRYWNGENFSNYQQLQRNPSQLKRFKNWLKKKK